MAAPSHTPSLGGVSSRPRDWGRAGEPGSAFIGLSKPARGRGRGGRGISASRAPPGDTSMHPSLPEKVDNSTKSKAPTPHTASKSSGPANGKPSTSPRRAFRVAPILVVDSSSLSEPSPSNPPETSSARTPNRRRRSQAHGKHPSSAAAKLDVPAPSFTRQQRSHSDPKSPSAKDEPPNQSGSASSTPSSNIRTDVDALVEHVRAIATHQRPITPGGHIDWAGDEDDTLPNLDDWGINTKTNSKEPSEGMSPLSVGGLASLPEPVTQSAAPSLEAGTETTPINNNHVAKPTVASERTNTFSRRKDGKNITRVQVPRPLPLNDQKRGADESTKRPPATAPSDSSFPSRVPLQKPHSTTSEHFKLPLHPSLPPKPVSAVIVPRTGTGAVPMRTPDPVKPTENQEIKVVQPPKSVDQTNDTPFGQSNAKPVKQPNVKPVEQSYTKPAEQSHTKPADQSHTKPVEQPRTKPVGQSHTKPVQPSDVTPVESSNTKPVEPPTIESVEPAEPSDNPQPNIEPSQEVEHSSVEPANHQVVEPVSEASHISTTDADHLAPVQPEVVTDVISEQGLAASMHAPKPSSESSPTDTYTSTQPRFRPTHVRNQTLGRIYPHSAQGHGHSHSDPSSRGRFPTRSHHHARTHSTPVMTTHRTSHVRPVITGEAISRLAKTIISSGKPTSRVAANAAPKE